jgi:transcriptional regulator with XRE-family HTH domain/DNA-directed RNA polymerase subunit RPC12/RpoP
MDQIKIGMFIQERRKEVGLTQSELAEKLNITDRAISKWERGICLPDASNMQELCSILNISINDLFSGEIVDMNDNEKKLEENLLEVARLKEEQDKKLLKIEIAMGILCMVPAFVLIFLAAFLDMQVWLRIVLIVLALIIILVVCAIALRIEQVAGYYECSECHHKYVPEYKRVLFAMHINRTRYMKCPNCGKRGWHKKVLK